MTNLISISVVIPAYNCANTIEATLDSIRWQTHKVDEIIVVNDGSNDQTTALLAEQHDITLINQINSGVSVARNTGIKAATSEYVAFLDADDIWLPDKIETTIQLMKAHPNAVVYYTYFRKWFANKETIPEAISDIESKQDAYKIECEWTYHKQLITNHVLTSTAIIKRDTLLDIGLFDPELTVAEDWDLMLRLSRKGLFCKSEKPLTLYRIDHDSLTSSIKEKDFASAVLESAIAKYGHKSPNGESVDMSVFNNRAYRRHLEYGAFAYKKHDFIKAHDAFSAALTKKITLKCFVYLVLSWIRK